MYPDYYAILGVSSTASFDEIRAAYGRRCRDCHPDRGGTHEQMVLINEAWVVLSNPETRRRYDEVRSGSGNQAEREAVVRDRRSAQQQAQDYPRRWADFEVWLNKIAADFTKAKYGRDP